eukprot:11567381-Alexandrium_andersonii.AAC.1
MYLCQALYTYLYVCCGVYCHGLCNLLFETLDPSCHASARDNSTRLKDLECPCSLRCAVHWCGTVLR